MLHLPLIVSLFTIVFALFLIKRIQGVSSGKGKMIQISQAIREGVGAFLKREFKIMALVFALIALGLGLITHHFLEALIFLVGAGVSSIAGYIGMMIATRANVRTCEAARTNFPKSFRVSFWGGQVMGFLVVGLGLLGIAAIWLLFENTHLLISYAFGSSLVALFLRVGGGIFTESADIGADLVGKVEKGIPEDDPRNPAVIADNVGDNVGDIAGMGSDLFESYVSAIIAAMVLGVVAFGSKGLLLPLILASAGILSSILGTFFIKISKTLQQKTFSEQTAQIRKAMGRGVMVANGLMVIAAYFIISNFFDDVSLFWALLAGLAVGMKRTILPVLGVAAATIIAYWAGGLYGVAIASCGILAVLGINLSTYCYGPIADNAAGIAKMAGLSEEVRQRTEALDAVGNTTAVAGKGFAIGSAALAALAWLAAFFEVAGLEQVKFLDPKIIAGLLLGAVLSFLFCSLTLKAASRGALEVVKEVRRQFKEIPEIMTGKARPDYGRCVDLTTKKSLKEMIVPGFLVVLVPILVGIILGAQAVGGVLAGSLITGFLLALMMANAGPSLNILIKLVGKVALIFLPLFL